MTDTEREIVCLCGSTRFKKEYRKANKRLSLEGKIVLSVGFFGHADGWPDEAAGPGGVIGPAKNCMDRLHKDKIDLADRIFVINPGGYVGESTKEEIEYAREQGVEIDTLDSPVLGHPECEMPDCAGFPWDDVQTVEDPSEEVMQMCDGCLNSEWGSPVEKVGQ